MTRSSDFAERIARLEHLLDAIEQARRGETRPSVATAGDTPADRLRELTALIQQRVRVPEVDDADAVALRALLAQFWLLTTEVRAQATDLKARLEALEMQAAHGEADLESLEDIR